MTALLRGWLDTRCSFWFIAPVHEAFVWKACSPWVQLAGARARGGWGRQARGGRFLELLQAEVDIIREMGAERKPGFFQMSGIKAL